MTDEVLDIAVVDDDPPVRDSLMTIFEIEGWRVRTYPDGDSFLLEAKRQKFDCVILDVHMPGRSGLEVLEALGGHHYTPPVFVISGQGDIPMAVTAIKNGAHDFLEKPFDADEVIAAVREAVEATRKRAAQGNDKLSLNFTGADSLTPREKDVLAQIAHGASNKEAGRTLGISPRTIEVHRARIMEKLGARNTADLVRIVFTDGG
ncbi:MAG: two component signal transduction system LuxR family response regulator [Saliniramus fredricksonii]|uniref:Two component signal transduction system LuxR family response regulator n=1 Tax=Saliniramus fredricksonii TaxID=1653334 RepID=A0A0P7XTB8_9HYPH|nr:response regulator [Saliniramus fredricksonii]KPQ10775.1 MAG: two component signal transduction system LuxR family response regulator [Saliniramus fredricksonii]SCC79520.1 Two-component response regulator, FixJ family, consists of REC and HTH domains [Saliniramus fredricksonii]